MSDAGKTFLIQCVLRHWLPGEAVRAPSLEVLKDGT